MDSFVSNNLDLNKAVASDYLVDRLHRFFTSGLLTLFAIATSIYLYFGSPLQCFVPDHYIPAWEQYTEQYCFLEHTYFVPADKPIPKDSADRQPRLFYYQWVPFFLLLQAICFHIPGLIWKLFSSKAGVEVSTILQVAKSHLICALNFHQEPDDVKRLETAAARLIASRNGEPLPKRRWKKFDWHPIKTLATLILSRSVFAEDRRKNGGNACRSLIPSTACLANLVPLYLAVKVLYLINAVVQLVLVNLMLGASLAQYPLFGFWLLADHLKNRDWWLTGLFPRIVYCDVDIRVLANTQRNTYQCVLQVNMFYEKIYLFLWIWIFALAIVTVGSIAHWVWLLLPRTRNAYVQNLLHDTRLSCYADESRDRHPVVESFIPELNKTYLGLDGWFLLYLIESNADRLIAGNVLDLIYKRALKHSKKQNVEMETASDELVKLHEPSTTHVNFKQQNGEVEKASDERGKLHEPITHVSVHAGGQYLEADGFIDGEINNFYIYYIISRGQHRSWEQHPRPP